MRLIRVRDTVGTVYDLEIDNDTSIGIDFQAYDFKEPGKRKINISNTFTVPATKQNLRTFGFPGNVHTISRAMYGRWYIDYWIDNVKFIDNSRLRIQNIDLETRRISLFIFEKEDIWEQFKLLLWPDFVGEFLVWMRDYKLLPVSEGSPLTWVNEYANITTFLEQFVENKDGITLPLFMGNLSAYQPFGVAGFAESESAFVFIDNSLHFGKINLYRHETDPSDDENITYGEGGHFCIFIRTVFEFIEYKYMINFYSQGGGFLGNAFNDSVISKCYVPARDICLRTDTDDVGRYWSFFKRNMSWPSGSIPGFAWNAGSYPGFFEPAHDVEDKPDKSLYDFVLAFIQHFNLVIDSDTTTEVKLRRFDEIESYGKIINWSGLAKRPVFSPAVDGYAQKNYVKFAAVYPDGDEYANAKTIDCLNTSLDAEIDLFTIDAYVPAVSKLNHLVMLDVAESFSTFQFLVNEAVKNALGTAVYLHERTGMDEIHASIKLYSAELVSMSTEYVTLAAMMQYPEFYEIDKWLSLHDMMNFRPFNMYYFQELNGCYYINKISGFNPEKSNAPTKLEVIKINNKAPESVYNEDYYVDGLIEQFSDGSGDDFYI